jgi:euchromatic histone-lysine N-methyltransferase
VRTWDFIPSGAPVIEYIGVLDRDDKLDNSVENDYIFDIDCLHTINGIDGREVTIQKYTPLFEIYFDILNYII